MGNVIEGVPAMPIPPKKLSEDDVVQLRSEKTELNRHSRRQTGMKSVCKGKTEGLLECQTTEGKCPEFDTCHSDKNKA
jgi:hypothetical protein